MNHWNNNSLGPPEESTHGPSKDHYCCYHFYIPETARYRTSSKATFYPTNCDLPKETPLDRAI
ncbi:LOW QUALITY PROTEIN: hypothetical protein ACHAXS_005955 [Conticribra weissflogii]